MILGNTRTSGFVRPAGANPNFHPRLPHTGFLSQINPFNVVSRRMGADRTIYRPPYPPVMGPQVLPDVPMPAAPVVPKAGGMAGFAGAGFGSTGGVQHPGHHPHYGNSAPSPYRTIRGGYIPGIHANGSNIRWATKHTGQLIHRSMPYQTAPLPELPPPPPPVVVAPAALVVAPALHGAHAPRRRRRNFFSRLITPETVAEHAACETVGPNSNGLYVTICDGRVTGYSDGKGNTQAYVTA